MPTRKLSLGDVLEECQAPILLHLLEYVVRRGGGDLLKEGKAWQRLESSKELLPTQVAITGKAEVLSATHN